MIYLHKQLLKQISLIGDSVLEETIQSEAIKYHTVSGQSAKSLASTFDKDLKWGVLKSPVGNKHFQYDPDSVRRRQKRESRYEPKQKVVKFWQSEDDFRTLDGGMTRTASALSGKK